MKEIIKRLTNSISIAENDKEDMEFVSWNVQAGVLISYNEAKIIVEALKVSELKGNLSKVTTPPIAPPSRTLKEGKEPPKPKNYGL